MGVVMLILNELVGFGVGGGQTSITFLQANELTTDLTTYTFSSQNLGTAAANRYIIIGATGVHNAARTLNSVTVGGVSATQIQNIALSNPRIAAIFVAAVPTGTTGDIVLTFSSGMSRVAYGAWALYTDTPATTAFDSANDTTYSSGLSISLDVPVGGYAVGVLVNGAASGTHGTTWTNLSEQYDTTSSETSLQGYSGAHAAYTSSPLSISATTSNGSDGNTGMVAASFS